MPGGGLRIHLVRWGFVVRAACSLPAREPPQMHACSSAHGGMHARRHASARLPACACMLACTCLRCRCMRTHALHGNHRAPAAPPRPCTRSGGPSTCWPWRGGAWPATRATALRTWGGGTPTKVGGRACTQGRVGPCNLVHTRCAACSIPQPATSCAHAWRGWALNCTPPSLPYPQRRTATCT